MGPWRCSPVSYFFVDIRRQGCKISGGEDEDEVDHGPHEDRVVGDDQDCQAGPVGLELPLEDACSDLLLNPRWIKASQNMLIIIKE